MRALEVSVKNLVYQNGGRYQLSNWLKCEQCGKIRHLSQKVDPESCCSYYSYYIAYLPQLAYGGKEIEGWCYVRKPLTMLFADVDYVLGMGGVQYKVEKRKVKDFRRPVPVVMVPKHLKSRAEWLFDEWLKAEEYIQTTALLNGLRLTEEGRAV